VSLRFDQPVFLWLILLAVPLLVVGWRAMAGTDRVRRTTSLVLRGLLILAAVILLAAPHSDREHRRLTVVGLIDVSGSMRRFAITPTHEALGNLSTIEYLRQWFREAAALRTDDDRFGLVAFDGEATAVAVPTRGEYIDDSLDITLLPGTNIADGLSLALAMLPADTARRIVLVSDGNETRGSALAAAQQAAAQQTALGNGTGVPIDVIVIPYQEVRDAQVVRVEAPANAQAGQVVTVRVILEATAPIGGALTLLHEGRPVDLNGAERGVSRRVVLPTGQSVQLVRVTLQPTRVNRFEAIFEPDADAGDALPQNNRAETFTATPSKGAILVVDRLAGQRETVIAQILTEAGIEVRTVLPVELFDHPLSLQQHDLVVLNDIAAYELSDRQQELLTGFVNDLGGGLLVIGGEHSYGAGGWTKTPVADILPVEVDPQRELRLPTAALVLVLDKSGSMNAPVGGARASQQEVANEGAAMAIESLRSDSLVGVVTFDYNAHEHIPLQRNDDPQELMRQVRSIRAEGGTDLAPALRMAHRMLRNVEAEKKRVVCLTDGQSETTDLDGIVNAMVADGIKITAIAVGDAADRATLERVAKIGGGEFYSVRNPRVLPRVLVDSVQVVNKPLIKEGGFAPVVLPTGSTLTIGMEQAPPLEGLVITAAREHPQVVVEMAHPEGEPLLALWQAGLGRVAAFTSDMDGLWSSQWIDWPTAAAFWTQLARTVMRPAVNQEFELITEMRGDQLQITLEATGDADFMEYVHVTGQVYDPDGQAQAVRLRQAAPGRYTATAAAAKPGSYIVALNPKKGGRFLSPVIGGATQTSDPEYRRYQPDPALLEEITDTTGGRRLDLSAVSAATVFDRRGMPVSISSLPMWRELLLIAIVLLMLDVASRRLAWDAAMIGRALRTAAARIVPARVRGERAAATLASLRRASVEAEARFDRKATGVEKLETPQSTLVEFTRDENPERDVKPSAGKVSAALSVLLGRHPAHPPADHVEESGSEERASLDDAEEAAPSDLPPDETAEEPEEGSGTTSSLLAAKRRARKHFGGG